MFGIDDAMGEVVTKATEPALAAIKLAWWRERLQELDRGKVPAEPRLQAAAEHLLPRGIAGTSLAGLEDGWVTLLDTEPDFERVAERGAGLFAMASRLLGADDPLIEAAGRLYARQDVRRRGLIDAPCSNHGLARHRFAKGLRPLTALAALAARDAGRAGPMEAEATPGRALALLCHRLTGRVG